MHNAKQIALQAKDLLTVCLAKAIDTALTETMGNQWFSEFCQEDAQDAKYAIVTKGQYSTGDMDLQALLKILRRRERFAEPVLQYYGFISDQDPFAQATRRQQLQGLLNRLINDFRNGMEAHNRASDIEKELSGHQIQRIYGYEDAVQDMTKLAQIFRQVTDANGQSYYDQILALTQQKKKRSVPMLAWLIPAVLAVVVTLAILLIPMFTGNEQPPTEGNVYYHRSAPVFVDGEVTITPVHIYYDSGSLVAVCYVQNGTDKTVSDLDVYYFTLDDGNGRVAAADFGKLQDVSIPANAHIEWTFRFPKSTIENTEGNLTDLIWDIRCK